MSLTRTLCGFLVVWGCAFAAPGALAQDSSGTIRPTEPVRPAPSPTTSPRVVIPRIQGGPTADSTSGPRTMAIVRPRNPGGSGSGPGAPTPP